jgi:hypothetical protein
MTQSRDESHVITSLNCPVIIKQSTSCLPAMGAAKACSTWKGVKILRSAGVSNTCHSRNAWLRSLMILAASILFASDSSS